MAVEPEDDELLLEDQVEGEEPDTDDEEEAEPKAEPEGEDDGLEFSFGDEAAPASGERDSALVRHLRNQIRERDKRLAALDKGQGSPAVEVGPKPTLEASDYDEERYERELEAWHDRRLKAKAVENQQSDVERQAQEEWQRAHQRYQAERLKLLEKAPDAEEAEGVALASLSEVQQAVIVKVADNAATLLTALGRHPGKLSELSQINDPLKMAAAVARLEGGLKVMPKRKAPEPEEIARGSASVAKGKDKHLERLEAEAGRTGDRSKLIAYKYSLKQRA